MRFWIHVNGKILDLYCDVLEDAAYRDKSHPLNSLDALMKLPSHPIVYIFKVLFYLQSNLLYILDIDSSYERNIGIYRELSKRIYQCMLKEMETNKKAEDSLNASKNLKSSDISKLQEILCHEVFLVVERIKEYRDKVNSETKIKVAVYSFEQLSSIDKETIEELKSLLINE